MTHTTVGRRTDTGDRRMRTTVAAVLTWVVAFLACPAVLHGQDKVNPRAAALLEFKERVDDYVALHDRVSSTLPPVGNSAPVEAVTRHRDALARALRKARSDAREGDLFTPDVAVQFRLIVRHDLSSRDFRDAIAAVEEVRYDKVWVNMSWPQTAPRATIPARILTELYPLPPDLEYRLLDHHLVLLDLDAELVVDLVRNVIPSSIRPRLK